MINRHLREGDKVRLKDFGLMKLEIESDKVDAPEDFKPSIPTTNPVVPSALSSPRMTKQRNKKT